MKVKSESEVAQSCPTLLDPWTAAHQAPPFMGFSRQEYWNGVPLPSPRESIVEVKDTGVEAWTRAVVAAEMDANRSRRQV